MKFVCLFWRYSLQWAMASSFTRFLDHIQRRTTVGRTPLDEWSARRRDLCLISHNTHNRQTSTPPVGFETTISAGERPQIYALDRAATGTCYGWCYWLVIILAWEYKKGHEKSVCSAALYIWAVTGIKLDSEHWYGHVSISVEPSREDKVTILWNQQVPTDRTIPNNKPKIIIRGNERGTCIVIRGLQL